jgi:hypothetical protein
MFMIKKMLACAYVLWIVFISWACLEARTMLLTWVVFAFGPGLLLAGIGAIRLPPIGRPHKGRNQ